ncbi:hypothetical protein QEN19_004173 [Hanseniaspora menglaensis]
MSISTQNNDLLVLQLKAFFESKAAEYSFIISTDKLSNLSMTVLKMIVNIYIKNSLKFSDFKKKMTIMRQPGVSNVKFDMFIEMLYKHLETEYSKATNKQSVIGIKNKKKNGVLQLVINSSNNTSNNEENNIGSINQELDETSKRLDQISKELSNCSVESDLIQLQPILQNDQYLYAKENIVEEERGRNYVNGVQVCLDPEMDLLKVSIQNKSMVSFYKQKLNYSPSQSNELELSTNKDSQASIKKVVAPKELPIHKHKLDILQLVNENHLSIITSQTGSGKSTQLPQFFLQENLDAKIIMTQPRRLAATSLAARISDEKGTKLGEEVGYKVRFDSALNDETKLIVATEGVLLTELTSLIKDKGICKYSHIIIDEAHERSLNLDVILSLIKLGIRMKLFQGTKILITSAGLNISDFTSFFYNLPVLDIGGSKNYPVTEIFAKRPVFDQFKETLNIVKRIHENENVNKSVLIFIPGLEEIEVVSELLSSHLTDIKLIKLHSIKENNQNSDLFAEYGHQRKIIVSTNIAETSVTLPSVSFMVNSGLYKLKTEFNNINKLTTVPITRMMQMQRVGRLGRVAKGTVYHLFTKNDYDLLIQNNISEIETTNLKLVMLIKNYINSSLQLIKEPKKSLQIKAELDLVNDTSITETKELTEMGKFIIKMPLAYTHSRLLYICLKNGCGRLGTILVSILSQRSPFVNNKEKKRRYESMFIDSSDHLSLVNIYIQYTLQDPRNTESWCNQYDLDFKVMQQTVKIKQQLDILLLNNKFNIPNTFKFSKCKTYDKDKSLLKKQGESEILLKSINTNLSRNNVAKKINLNEYQILSNGLMVKVHPSSSFVGKIGDLPDYLCFEEVLVLNDVNYILNISEFEPTIVINEEYCRGDYRVVKKIGSDLVNVNAEALKLLKEWQILKKHLFILIKRLEEATPLSVTKKNEDKYMSKKAMSPALTSDFLLKKKKKRKLNL